MTPRRHVQYMFLLGLMVLAALSEIISIGAILPFLGVLTAPEKIFGQPALKPLIEFLGLTAPEQLLLPLTVAFGIAALIAGALRLLLMHASSRISFGTGSDLSISIYHRTLYQPYSVHVARNSSEVISGISDKSQTVCFGIIAPVVTMVSSSLMLIAILAALVCLDPRVALVAFGGFAVIYFMIIRSTRRLLHINSQITARESVNAIKALQEGLGGIRDVLLDGSQKIYRNIYSAAEIPLRRAQATNQVVYFGPRYVMEGLGMLLFSALGYYLSQESDGIGKAIPILGALALGAQRLLPILQQVYASWVYIKSNEVALGDILGLLDQPLPPYADKPPPEPLPFTEQIGLNNLTFRYGPQHPCVLQNLNLKIKRGSRVGFIGPTGSGKSTLLDIVMGLIIPTEGTLEIDGQTIGPKNYRAWQVRIAHVPQAIFLSDATIEENIAFGVPKNCINAERVRHAAGQAQIADLIASWANGYKTMVGERGVRLSGGQRQRIGIARALYKNADVIIFDEATSALDNETELAVMGSIEGLSKDLTLLIIAHRLTTLKSCNQIVELAGGKVQRIGSYAELIAGGSSVENRVLSSS